MDLITLPIKSRSNAGLYRLWVTPSGRYLLALTGHDEGPNRLRRWDLAGRRPAGVMNVVSDDEHGIAHPPPEYSADFRLMTVGTDLRRVGGDRRVTLAGPVFDSPIDALYGGAYDQFAFAPDGGTVFGRPNTVTSGQPWRIDRWDIRRAFADGTERLRPVPGGSLVLGVGMGTADFAVSPAGDLLAAGRYDGGTLHRWRLPAGDPLPPLALTPRRSDGSCRVRFGPDGRTLAVATDKLRLFDPAADRPRATLPVAATDLAFTPDGGRLVTVQASGRATVWDVAAGRPTAELDFRQQCGRLAAVVVAPDGLTAIAGGTRGRLVRWDV